MREYSIGKPHYVQSFKIDLAKNFHNHFLSEGKQIYLRNVIMECEIYAMDICLHFKKESGGLLPEDWLKHMIAEAYDATIELFPAAEETYSLEACISSVSQAIYNGSAENMVYRYYNHF